MIFLSFDYFFIFIVLFCHSWGETRGEEDGDELTAENFNSTITTNSNVLVMFYAPWCPHCIEAKPHFLKAAEEIKKVESNSIRQRLVLCNCEMKKNSGLCNELKIEGFPTVRYYEKGEFKQEYFNEISTQSLINFMKNPQDFAAGYNKADEDSAAAVDVTMKGVTYLTAENASNFLLTHPHVLVFYYTLWCSVCSEAKPKYEKAQEIFLNDPHNDKILAAVNCEDEENEKWCSEQKIDGFPTVRYYYKGELYQEYDLEIETDAIVKYLRDPPKRKIIPQPMEIIHDNFINLGNVIKLSATSFATHAKGPEGSTLVMFHDPWNIQSNDAQLIYKNAANAALKDYPKHVFAFVDCGDEVNMILCREEKVTEFPAFKLYIKGKQIADYNEKPFSQDGILQFLSRTLIPYSHAKDEL